MVAALADHRLVTISGDTVEVAHEALLREWPRLRAWLEEDTDGRRLHRRLAAAAHEWSGPAATRVSSFRGARLGATLDWARTHDDELNEGERAFIDASRRESETEATRTRRLNRRLTGLLAGVLALLALVAGASALFLEQRGEARDRARIADARRLAAQALLEDDLDLLAVARASGSRPRRLAGDARRSAHRVSWAVPPPCGSRGSARVTPTTSLYGRTAARS